MSGSLRKGAYVLSFGGIAALLVLVLWRRELYLPLSLLMIGLAMLPFFIRFERRRLRAEELLLIAMLGAIAAVSRVPFAALPSVQPVSFVVIMAALVLERRRASWSEASPRPPPI